MVVEATKIEQKENEQQSQLRDNKGNNYKA